MRPREILPGINLPIKTVDRISKIPISYVYYITSLNCYAININGMIIKGDICDILPYGSPKTSLCSYGLICKNQNTCQFYHKTDKCKRAFTPGSWIYNPISARNRPSKYYTRHIGNASTLLFDIKMLSKSHYNEEVNNRETQLIHDLLIYTTLNTNGLIDEYKQW